MWTIAKSVVKLMVTAACVDDALMSVVEVTELSAWTMYKSRMYSLSVWTIRKSVVKLVYSLSVWTIPKSVMKLVHSLSVWTIPKSVAELLISLSRWTKHTRRRAEWLVCLGDAPVGC